MLHTYPVVHILVQIIQRTADKIGQPSYCRLFAILKGWHAQDFGALPWPPSFPDFPLSSALIVVVLLMPAARETLSWGMRWKAARQSTGISSTPAPLTLETNYIKLALKNSGSYLGATLGIF